jgi:hypothetical protein
MAAARARLSGPLDSCADPTRIRLPRREHAEQRRGSAGAIRRVRPTCETQSAEWFQPYRVAPESTVCPLGSAQSNSKGKELISHQPILRGGKASPTSLVTLRNWHSPQPSASPHAAFPSPCVFSATFPAKPANPTTSATCRPSTIALRWFSEFSAISTVFRENRSNVPTGTFVHTIVPGATSGRDHYRIVSSISEIQSGRFKTSRGLGPSAAPTIPSCSIRSIRCAARP